MLFYCCLKTALHYCGRGQLGSSNFDPNHNTVINKFLPKAEDGEVIFVRSWVIQNEVVAMV